MSHQAPSSLVADCRGEDSRKIFSDVHLEAEADPNSTTSDSSISNASYPLAQAAQRQRRLNSTSNLRRSRFTGPCFGLLSGTADPTKTPGGSHPGQASPSEPSPGSSSSQLQGEGYQSDFSAKDDHVSVPVFAISEEEDRQPLVLAELLGESFTSSMLNGQVRGSHEVKGSAMGSPQSQANGLLLQRARPEWRPWGSQASGGASPLPSSSLLTTESKPAFVHSTANDAHPSLSQSTAPRNITGKEM